MKPETENFEVANGTLRRDGLPIALPKGLVFRSLVRSGWKGLDGALPADVARHLVQDGPFHMLFTGKVA